ncbi:MAG: diaminopimelate epimerase [Proteobacteria bacterium]|nr:diaminopimelate epimerase [Desulfobacteraceae bacterium]MBU3979823.1 diaminopimelate epimerase [Pseudomonadota bacterium]MBU4012266.1 diaminopimelate epimerase [Pseudomonadota bacterium]MBU4067721.1 diaminopimelate epimerase [Pseudomonadota bacterium]MBU4100503.1 diaminopimelate epimerase [Pseudomonadota bacterium]
MKDITFYKMSGSGNDFIIIDNRNRVVDEGDLQGFIAKVCRRKMSVGADGLILVEESENVDFKWRFFNADGSSAEMCGNGARCAARFAYLNGISGAEVSFETKAGIVSAQVKNDLVKIKVPNPIDLKTDYNLELGNGAMQVSSVNTGVPHVVITVGDIDDVDVVKIGREIRFHDRYAPAGTNVNFISSQNDNTILIRTYERGVEDETLACGTGSIAAAIVMHYKSKGKSPVKVITRGGGCLYIYFEEDNGKFYNVFLEGDARVIYKGYLGEDALKV